MTNGVSNLEPLYGDGARIKHNYLERQQEIIAVNRNDLEDILSFDGMQSLLSGFGLFLLSGALWLGLDKILSEPSLAFTPELAICGCCVLFGVVFLSFGLYMGAKKRGRITRIYRETKAISA